MKLQKVIKIIKIDRCNIFPSAGDNDDFSFKESQGSGDGEKN